MAKGAATKAKVLKEIMNLYGDAAFLSPDGKELRIEATEDGEIVQIKVALTCAKVNIERGGEAISAPTPAKVSATAAVPSNPATNLTGPTEEEKQMIANLLEKMGM